VTSVVVFFIDITAQLVLLRVPQENLS